MKKARTYLWVYGYATKSWVKRLLPDTEKYASGYLWLDRLTSPFWNWYADRLERKLFQEIGDGDEAKGRHMLKVAVILEDFFDYDDEAMT